MAGYDRKFIQSHAVTVGSSESWVDFLKSEAVAKKVADRAWEYLSRRGYPSRERRRVTVEPSNLYEGTWRMTVFLPGITRARDIGGGEAANRRGRQIAEAAVRAAYSNQDLVTSW